MSNRSAACANHQKVIFIAGQNLILRQFSAKINFQNQRNEHSGKGKKGS